MDELTITKEKRQDYARIESWLKKVLLDDYDKFDLKATYDSELSYIENKNIVREQIKEQGLIQPDLKEQVEYVKAQTERLETQEKNKAEAEVKEYNSKLSIETNKDTDAYYQPIYRIVDKICNGYSNLCFVKGRAGIGKSRGIRATLLKNNTEFVEVAGEVTDAYLYRLLYDNNGKVIWLKDISNLLSSTKSLQILKAATETEEARVITKSNYSKQQADLPDRFICRCKFIFDYNNVQSNMREDFEALISRGDFVEFTLSPKEINHVMRSIAKSDEEKTVTEFIIKNFEGSGLVRLNLRTQWKAFNTYKYAVQKSLDWKEEISNELKRVSKTRSLIYDLIGNDAVRRVDLKKLLLKYELVNSIRVAEMRIVEWLFLDELKEWNEGERNGYVSLLPKNTCVEE